MKYAMGILLCMLMAGVVLAASPRTARHRMQASMLITGFIVVAADGSVKSYLVDRAGQLPREVVDLIDRNVPAWRFEPVVRDGKPVVANAPMHLRLLAKPVGKEDYALSIAGTDFGRPHDGTESPAISFKQRTHPGYPKWALDARVSGTVYLLLALDRAGRVQHVDAEQVNLGVVGGDREMMRWRSGLARAAVETARDWTFNVPDVADDVAPPFWLVRVPMNFTLKGFQSEYGEWRLYLPGQRVVPSWAANLELGQSADTGEADAVSAVMDGLRRAKSRDGV